MNISPWLIYLWGIADQIQRGMAVVGVLLLVAGVFFYFASNAQRSDGARKKKHAYGDTKESDEAEGEELQKSAKILRRRSKVFQIVGLLLFTAALLTPSSKTIAIMVVAPAIVNSEPIQKDLPEIYNLAKDALKEALKPE